MIAADITLRAATANDALCLGMLGTQVFLDTYATDGIRPPVAREVLAMFSTETVSAQLAQPDTRFIVAERAGHLLGFAKLALNARHALVPAQAAAELDKLYVQEPFTGIGLGRALLAEAEVLVASQGAAMLWLTTWVGNTRARAFYPRQGYRELGVTVYEFQNEQHENRLFAKALGQ